MSASEDCAIRAKSRGAKPLGKKARSPEKAGVDGSIPSLATITSGSFKTSHCKLLLTMSEFLADLCPIPLAPDPYAGAGLTGEKPFFQQGMGWLKTRTADAVIVEAGLGHLRL